MGDSTYGRNLPFFFEIITDYVNVELIMNCNKKLRYPMQRGCIIHGVIDQDFSFHTLLNN